jgi:uncharacterized Zn finger protein
MKYMKCSACGYDDAAPFVKIHVPDGIIIVKKNGKEHWENGDTYQTLYGCPKCGTLRLDYPLAKKEHGKFSGCKCPWCGNIHPDEFAIHKEERMRGLPGQYTNYRMTCSCGASGPDADSEEEAIEKYSGSKTPL